MSTDQTLRDQVLRLAHSYPEGSTQREALMATLDKDAAQTWAPADGRSKNYSRQKKKPEPWMWFISQDGTGGWIVTVGDPRRSSSKTKFSTHDEWDLKDWVRENVGSKVSEDHIMDLTRKGWVSPFYSQWWVDTNMGQNQGSRLASILAEEGVTRSKRQGAHRLDGVRRHTLMPSAIKRKLPKLYSQEDVEDPMVQVKYFSPYSQAVWYVTEFDGQDTMFGYADLGMGGGELGYISLRELEGLNKRGLPLVERDMYWKPRPLSQAKRSRMASQTLQNKAAQVLVEEGILPPPLPLSKTARENVFDYEKGDVGVRSGSAHGWMNFINVYSPIDNIGKRGKRVKKREVRIDDTMSNTAWSAEFLSRIKGSSNVSAVNKKLDKLMEEAREKGAKVYDHMNEYKGVDQDLPTPKSHMVDNINGSDISIDLNSKPINLYSKSYSDKLEEMNMVYWFKIHPRFKKRLQAIAEDLERAKSIDDASKMLTEAGVKYDRHSYMHPMYD